MEDHFYLQTHAFHGVGNFVIGMSIYGYQTIKAIIPSTNLIRETNTFIIFAPPKYTTPKVSAQKEVLLEATSDSSQAYQSIDLQTSSD